MMLVEDNWQTIERDIEHTPFDKVLLALFLIAATGFNNGLDANRPACQGNLKTSDHVIIDLEA